LNFERDNYLKIITLFWTWKVAFTILQALPLIEFFPHKKQLIKKSLLSKILGVRKFEGEKTINAITKKKEKKSSPQIQSVFHALLLRLITPLC